MRKETLIKLFVVGIVLLFVIEIIAIPFLGGTVQQAEQPTGRPTLGGTIRTEATVTAFEPSLIVVGKDSRLDETRKRLAAEKLITFTTPVDDKTLLVNLASPSAMRNASAEFRKLNLSVFVNARISLPSQVDFVSSEGEQLSVGGTDFSVRLAPDFEVGDRLGISFDAEVNFDPQTGAPYLARYGNLRIVPSPKAGLLADAKVEKVLSAVYTIPVRWENRRLNMSMLEERFGSLPGKPAYTFTQKSFVIVNASAAELEALKAKNVPYITQVTLPDTVSINTAFTDRGVVLADLGNLSAVATFPESEIRVEYNVSEGFDSAKAGSDVEKAAEGLGYFSLGYSERILLVLPEFASDESGKNYSIPADSTVSLLVQKKHAVNETVKVVVDASLVGDRVAEIGSVKLANS